MSDPTYLDNVNDALAHNVAEFMEHGPGLRYTTRHGILAVDPWQNGVLLTGLGAMGVGTMWSTYSSYQNREVREAIKGGCPIERADNGIMGLTGSHPNHGGPNVANLLDKYRPGWRDWPYCPPCGKAIAGDGVTVNGALTHYECHETALYGPAGGYWMRAL